ncbi:MAG: LCP family protein [Anaerolineae bacterium]|nr:LCP family protein [Anaerolineae bacterium]
MHTATYHPVRKALLSFLAVIVISGALYSGFLFFTTVRALVAQTAVPFAENVVAPVARSEAEEPPKRVRHSPGASELPDIAAQKDRVNILLLGIDQRDNDPGPWRTDTMILVSLDPATQSASMLSIPRDLWVPIPGMGESRLNMAHYLGDANDFPGGGPALAQKTVWYALGIPVHYYVRVNFDGFERMVDAIGGVTVNVEKPIHDEEYPDSNYGTMVIDIPAGVQHMDGKTALQFARSRHGTNDWDRMARQQALIVAARDKVLSLDIPLSSLPKMLDLAGDTIKTDLTFSEMYALAQMVKEIDRDKIRHGVIDRDMTTTVITPEKWMVEVPDWEKVRQLVDELFPAPSPSAEPNANLVESQLAAEGARIALQNGTLVTGLAEQMTESLRQAGFNVVRYENAERFDHAETTMIVHVDKPYTITALAGQLDIKPDNIRSGNGAESSTDITVILGRDHSF